MAFSCEQIYQQASVLVTNPLFTLSLLFVLSPCLSYFSGKDETVDDDCRSARLKGGKTAFCACLIQGKKLYHDSILKKGLKNT